MRSLLLALGFPLLCGVVAAQARAQTPITQGASLSAAIGVCTLATAHQHQ